MGADVSIWFNMNQYVCSYCSGKLLYIDKKHFGYLSNWGNLLLEGVTPFPNSHVKVFGSNSNKRKKREVNQASFLSARGKKKQQKTTIGIW